MTKKKAEKSTKKKLTMKEKEDERNKIIEAKFKEAEKNLKEKKYAWIKALFGKYAIVQNDMDNFSRDYKYAERKYEKARINYLLTKKA